MQVWNVLHAARWKYKTHKKSPKIRHLRTIAQFCRAVSSQLSHIILSTVGKKLLKQQYLLHQQISTGFASWLRYCSDVAQRRSTKLYTMFGRLLCRFWGFLPPNGILPGGEVQNSLCVQVLRSPILAALLHGTRAAAVSQTSWRGTRNGIGFSSVESLSIVQSKGQTILYVFADCATYIRLGGHHVRHRLTF